VGIHRPGVFAERVCVPRRSVVALGEDIEASRAVLAEPLACCVGAIGVAEPPKRTLILGCGPIGLLATALVARQGGEVVAVDPLPERQALALAAGASAVAASLSASYHGSFDVVLDAAGFELTWRTGIDSLRPGGELVVLGLGQADGAFPMATVVRRSIRVRGHFAYCRAEFEMAVRLLADRSFNFNWVDEVALSDGAVAFEKLAHRPSQFTKLLLRP
jgi:threonine dehydrogenase-like Zn-dependent dehydrogenase